MNIGIICHANLGGSSRIAGELAIELSRRGHRMHLFSRTEPFAAGRLRHHVALHSIFKSQGKTSLFSDLVVEWPPWEVKALLDQVLRVFEWEGLDLLHFHYALPFAAIVEELKNRLGPAGPLVLGTLHGTDVSIYGCHPTKGPQLAQAIKQLDGLTTVSFSHAILASQIFGLSELPEVIPNFVNLSRFRPDPLTTSRFQSPRAGNRRKFKIVHISNFRAVKNPQGLACIFLGICEKLKAELWLVGHGPETGWLQTFFQEKGLQQSVRFLGPQPEVASILTQCDLLLMPSLAESFCLVALEAMACGVPVLATAVGGLPEVVVHGRNGLLFPPEEPLAAVDLAVQLLSNPIRHRAMREAAVRHAQNYEQNKVVTFYEKYYRKLMFRRLGGCLKTVRAEGRSFSRITAHL